MSVKPDDVSQEAWDAACNVWQDLSIAFKSRDEETAIIARAIMAANPVTATAGMTHEQQRVLSFVRRYQVQHQGVSPSYAEIGAEIGRSSGNVFEILHRMQDRGILSVPAKRARAITILARA